LAVNRHLGLGVVETRWFDERHHTVRPLFEFLSYALKDRSDAFIYERFVSANSFREAVRFIMSAGDIEYLYIAAHGDFGKIVSPDGSRMSRTYIRNTFCEINRRRRRLKGVLVGSCKFGGVDNLIELLRPSHVRGTKQPNRLLWVGGYGQEIDYTRSSLFDIHFYDLFFRTSARTEIERVEKTLDQLNRYSPGLVDGLSLSLVAKLPNGRFRDMTKKVEFTD
jgi:hypothetical protein